MNIKKLDKEIEEAKKIVDDCNRLTGYAQDNKVKRAAAMGTYQALLAVRRCFDEQ